MFNELPEIGIREAERVGRGGGGGEKVRAFSEWKITTSTIRFVLIGSNYIPAHYCGCFQLSKRDGEREREREDAQSN